MVNLYFEQAWLPEGWARDVLVEVDDKGIMTSVTPNSSPANQSVIRGACIPGLANLHSHAFQRAMVGLTERAGPGNDSFWTWRQVMYKFVDQLTPEDLEAIAAQLYVEMLEAGYTAVAEFHYLHHSPSGQLYDNPAEMSERVIAAADDTGIGMTLLPVVYANGGFGKAPSNEGQRRFLHDGDQYTNLLSILKPLMAGKKSGMRLGIAPHSLRAVDPDLLAEVTAAIDSHDSEAPIHVHIAEQVKEVEDCLNWSGQHPVEWLLSNVDVNSRWCLIHATHLTETETVGLAKSGAVAGICPTTEGNLGDGIFPLQRYLQEGGIFGLGSDSHISVSITEEIRLLEYGQRLKLLGRNIGAMNEGASTGASLYRGSLKGGAQALGRKTGVIKVGKMADLAVLDTDEPGLYSREGDAILDSWIFFNSGRNAIRDVYVAGRQQVSGGQHHKRDAIASRFKATMDKLTG